MEPTDIISIIIATTAAAIALLIYVYTRNSTNDTRLRAFDVSTPNSSVVAEEIRGHRYEDHLWETPIGVGANQAQTGIPDFHKKKFNNSAGEKIENLKAITATAAAAAGQGNGAIREVRAYNPAIGVVHPPPIRNARS